MGRVIHDAIVVSSWDIKMIAKAHTTAKSLMAHVGDLVPYVINGGASFLIAPDGSKEGWSESDLADDARVAFKKWIKAQAYEDGSNAIDLVHVRYGSDFGQPKVINALELKSEQPIEYSKNADAIAQLRSTSATLKAKEVDGLEDGDIADMYEDIDLCLDNIGKMGEGI